MLSIQTGLGIAEILGVLLVSYGLLRESFAVLARKRPFGEGRYGEGEFGGGTSRGVSLIVGVGKAIKLLPPDGELTLRDHKRNGALALAGVIIIIITLVADLRLSEIPVGTSEEPRNRISEAAVLVVQDLVPRERTGLDPYLAARWASGSEEAIPAALLSELLETSGLEVAPPGMIESGDSTVIILYMLQPMVSDSDTVRVLGGWLGLTGGDGGGVWGNEFLYHLDCSRSCRILSSVARGSFN